MPRYCGSMCTLSFSLELAFQLSLLGVATSPFGVLVCHHGGDEEILEDIAAP